MLGVTQSTSSVSTKEKRKVLKKGVDKGCALWYSSKAVAETASTTEKQRMRERKKFEKT